MPLPLQTKLLRVLENRTVQRVGGNDEIESISVLCAPPTRISKRAWMRALRADLYYRINVFPIQVPSPAERQVDIPLIASAIMEQLADGRVGGTPAMDQSAMTELSVTLGQECARASQCPGTRAGDVPTTGSYRHSGPRESAAHESTGSKRGDGCALGGIARAERDRSAQEAGEPPLPHPAHYADWFSYFDNIDLRRHLRDIEVVLIEAALEKSDGMVSQAAEALKLRRTTLIEKMKKLMIERPPSAKEG